MGTLKILTVLIKLKGGVGRSNTEIARVLSKKGHEVEILSREDDLKIYSFINSIFPLRKKIKEMMKEKNYDIIYTQDYSCALSLLIPYPVFWRKHVCCFCGMKNKSKYLAMVIQYITGVIMGKKLIGVSDSIKTRFPKSSLIYRGINLDKFTPLNKERKFIGWTDRDIETITEEDLQEISDSTGLKLRIAKDIPLNKINEFYNKCKVFISLPRTAGFNNSWSEAMATGVPIVIGNYNGAGFFFPFNKVFDDENKIEKIKQIIKNPKKINYRKWLIKNGFSWEEKAEEVETFLDKVNKRHRDKLRRK